MKYQEALSIMMIVSLFTFSAALGAGEKLSDPTQVEAQHGSGDSSADELTLKLKPGYEDIWELRNQSGDLLGIVESVEKKTFKIYDSKGMYLGFVYESTKWVPRGARQKRELKISISDIKLYLDILTASGDVSFAPGELTLEPKQNIKDEWLMRDRRGNIAGTVKKAEISFRFYDRSNNFMGFIYPSGFWMPKWGRLGINRREVRITPVQAQFSLDVYKAIEHIR